ncbi:AraC family transcriptional regulator [Opitutaceae bacterium TAV4]|nr:AraC family transcriptional regulator [Opitutaceae bacterium TAV4]RRJ99625.1 AraC family transcriptional regulator [Opitutaceae bacterium TAV3]
MKLLVSSDFSERAAAIFREDGHDVTVMRGSDGATPAMPPPDTSRILVARAETLPALTRMDCGPLGVLLLDDKAASASGLRNLLLPLLRNWQQKQLDGVFTLVSGDTCRRVNYLSYEHGHEVARVVVPADCSEHFLHAGSDSHDELRTFGIKLAGISRVSPPYEVRRNRYDFHIFALVESGALEISSPTTRSTVKPGDMLVIPAGTQCCYRSRIKTTFLWFHLIPEMFPDICSSGTGGSPHVARMLVQDVLMTYARHYREEAAGIYPDSGEVLVPLATLIGQILRRQLADMGISDSEHNDRHTLQRAMSLLRNSTTPFWSVHDLARAVGCSDSRFYRLTHRILQKTPYQMVLDVRMQRACDLLAHTTFKLEQIAMATGYADAFSFSSAFKRHTGKNPSEYRDTHRFPA